MTHEIETHHTTSVNEYFQYIQQTRQNIIDNMIEKCHHLQRDERSVQLLAVSKTQSVDKIRAMYQAGQRQFAENYVQEAIDKIQQLADLDIQWHFIGHVQRNKTKLLAEHFAWVQGVDRMLIAERLSQQRPSNLPALNICLQVNIDEQDSKDGCHVDDVAELVETISQLERIRLRGLMIIPAVNNHDAFVMAKQLFEQVRQYHHQPKDWDTLSMGMSGDYLTAIEHGSTMIRIGTALFGERVYL